MLGRWGFPSGTWGRTIPALAEGKADTHRRSMAGWVWRVARSWGLRGSDRQGIYYFIQLNSNDFYFMGRNYGRDSDNSKSPLS